MSVLALLVIIAVVLLVVTVVVLATIGGARSDKAGHDDRDFACIHWWGDRQGSSTARCPICNPTQE